MSYAKQIVYMQEDLKEEDLKVEEVSSTVSLNGCGVAPRKMRTVARVLKNRSVEESLCLLSYIEKKCVVLFEDLLKSAFSSLERKCVDADGNVIHVLSEKKVFVKTISVDSGGYLKRFRSTSRGRACVVKKRLSSVTLVVNSFIEKNNKDGAKV